MNENLKDQEKVENSFLKQVWERNLADDTYEIGKLNEADGGTLFDEYIASNLSYPTIVANCLANKVSTWYASDSLPKTSSVIICVIPSLIPT